jgi:arylsulfatase A-like enzyme
MARLANSKIEVSKDRAPRLPVVSDEEAVLLASLYDGEVAYIDHELRRLFAALERRGFLDNAIVLFTSDHGEERSSTSTGASSTVNRSTKSWSGCL